MFNIPEEQLHAATKSGEVDHVVEGALLLHVSEQGHADDGVNKCDKRQQRSNIEQGRKRYNQGKQQLADTLGSLQIKRILYIK